MKRNKPRKAEKETARASTSFNTEQEEFDLTHYVHDRVELMHQVFSLLKPKEIKALVPQCARHLPMDSLQELCTEEVLGISSKRLVAILDGAEPPSDTESSSQSPTPQLETISLDSISSDDEILSQGSRKKKKHKHRRCGRKAKKKRGAEDDDKSKASRAGLTVLELLELQARARAIKAQLQKEQALKTSETAVQSHESSESEVEIKEEPAEVVEISSDEEKPKIEDLQEGQQQSVELTQQTSIKPAESQTISVTRRVNDLVITVPQAKATRKIKLNRNRTVVSADLSEKNKSPPELSPHPSVSAETQNLVGKVTSGAVELKKKTKKKKKMKKTSKMEEVDNDEITLQLSDSEKMDVLQSLERKVSSSDDYNGSSDGNSCSGENIKSISSEKRSECIRKSIEKEKTDVAKDTTNNNCGLVLGDKQKVNGNTDVEIVTEIPLQHKNGDIEQYNNTNEKGSYPQAKSKDKHEIDKGENLHNDTEIQHLEETKEIEDTIQTSDEISAKAKNIETNTLEVNIAADIPLVSDKELCNLSDSAVNCTVVEKTTSEPLKSYKDLSEGEVTDQNNSEVETIFQKQDVACLSDQDSEKKKKHKKKKAKKAKKEKKHEKLDLDFQESDDQNFYQKDSNKIISEQLEHKIEDGNEIIVLDDDIQEILELSDDSSCCEVEGAVLSKEPTTEEIEALSAKIDEIERDDVVTQEQMEKYEKLLQEKQETFEDLENISWKDRYLDSKKVKQVMTTSNLFNIMRKKNKELRMKMEEAKKIEETKKKEVEKAQELKEFEQTILEEGSTEQYNTLQGSTKYVDPVKEVSKELEKKKETQNSGESNSEVELTKEMKKDAKQLLKMFRKLLKYNDIEGRKNSTKKKKKHKSKNKSDNVSGNVK